MNRYETLADMMRANVACFLALAISNAVGFAAIAGGLAQGEMLWAVLGLLWLYVVNLPVYVWLSATVAYSLLEWTLPDLSLEVAWFAGSVFYLSVTVAAFAWRLPDWSGLLPSAVWTAAYIGLALAGRWRYRRQPG